MTPRNDVTADLAEQRARQVKAIALADVLDAAGAADLPAVSDEQWRLAEAAAGVRPASLADPRVDVGVPRGAGAAARHGRVRGVDVSYLNSAARRSLGEVVSRHVNSEGELTTVEKVSGGEFAGQYLLCIYDDDTPTIAPTLLDDETWAWLREALDCIEAREQGTDAAAGTGGRT